MCERLKKPCSGESCAHLEYVGKLRFGEQAWENLPAQAHPEKFAVVHGLHMRIGHIDVSAGFVWAL